MSVKKSLIVDDSKSARAVLKRMLESLGLEVDSVESAREAISYLEEHQPDVIFMDHMMPEMDGFEAVKLIKSNPQTAAVPILMYTSKGGDVYLSQARELGAVGIISKTISPVGLKESLFQLGLVDERRTESNLVKEEPLTSNVDTQILAASILDKKDERSIDSKELQRLLDDQTIELHKSMWLGIESVSNEIFNKLKTERLEQLEETQSKEPEKKPLPFLFAVVCILFVISLALNIKLWGDKQQEQDTVIERSQTQSDYAARQSGHPNPRQQNIVAEERDLWLGYIVWAHNRVIEYPFDELALDEGRLQAVSEVIDRAVEVSYRGKIILQTHTGKFCYSQNEFGEYQLAEEKLPTTQCSLIDNRLQPADDPYSHQSLSFANYLSDIAQLRQRGIIVEVESVSRDKAVVDYPVISETVTADIWNAAAQQNNRVTIILEPADDEFIDERY